MDDNAHQQSDSDALASALGAIGAGTDDGGGGGGGGGGAAHRFHHQLQQPDFTHSHKGSGVGVGMDAGHDDDDDDEDIDVNALDIPVEDDDGVMHGDDDLDLDLGDMTPHDVDTPQRTNSFGRPPSIRKACDLCHAAKQKCSGDRPSCTRCAAGGWACVYAPRQRRRTVPKEHKLASQMETHRTPNLASLANTPAQANKKRKLGQRESLGAFGSGEMDMKLAMGMAVDLGLAGDDDGEEMMTMTDDQMLESIAIDGYLADLPLATFVHNLPFTATQSGNDGHVNYNADDFSGGGDNTFPSADMDQHTTSALRDAIFSLNESSGGNAGQGEGAGDDGQGGEGQGEGAEGIDPHLALLDLSHAMPGEGDGEGNEHGHESGDHGLNLSGFSHHGSLCNHAPRVQHILAMLTQHNLDAKPGSNTPLTLGVFNPLARSLRLFHALAQCSSCSSSPQQTLPQLALLSRTTTMLTFPFPAINSSSVGSSAQITLHGARLSGTGLSEAIEQHIVGVVWDSWRAAVREIFASLERKAQEIITSSAATEAANGNGNGNSNGNGNVAGNASSSSSAETQRAGLMFQAMSRLVTAMDEVEEN